MFFLNGFQIIFLRESVWWTETGPTSFRTSIKHIKPPQVKQAVLLTPAHHMYSNSVKL